jgi:hypothetical protein
LFLVLADVVVDSVWKLSRKHSFPFYAFSSLWSVASVGSDRVAWFLCAGNDLPLALQHLHRHTSRKIRKLRAISIKLTPIRYAIFVLSLHARV